MLQAIVCKKGRERGPAPGRRGVIGRFESHLIEREMAPATVDKYVRDVIQFVEGFQGYRPARLLAKRDVIAYKSALVKRYAPASVNSMLAALNCYLDFIGRPDLKAKHIKVQRETYRSDARDLTREEYVRLVSAARLSGRARTALIIQTLCATGIRVSELQFVEVEAVREGCIIVTNKGKVRSVWLPERLQKALLVWARAHGVKRGPIFCTKSGRPLDRVYVWREMKLVAAAAGIAQTKVYPHNLRHLFALVYYGKFRDLSALCDLMGHARVETTRIYVTTTGKDRRQQVASLGLIA